MTQESDVFFGGAEGDGGTCVGWLTVLMFEYEVLYWYPEDAELDGYPEDTELDGWGEEVVLGE